MLLSNPHQDDVLSEFLLDFLFIFGRWFDLFIQCEVLGMFWI